MKQKRVLSVQDVSCFGKCSNTVALPVLSAADIEAVRDQIGITASVLYEVEALGFDAPFKHCIGKQPLIRLRAFVNAEGDLRRELRDQFFAIRDPRLVGGVRDIKSV